MRPCRPCPACRSPIFARCASPPGTACATLRALLCPARAPRGSTRGPRGAGGSSGPRGSTHTCSACASRRGEGALPRFFYPPVIPPSEHANSTPSRRGRSGLWRRRAVRAPVGDAAAPSRRATRSKDAGRRAGRSSSPAGSCLSAMGGAAARGTCAACAARARPWRRAATTRDGPARPPSTAPHRPADALRSPPIAGGEVELALRSGARQGTLPA